MRYIKLLPIVFVSTLASQNAMASDLAPVEILKKSVETVTKTLEGGVEAIDAIKNPVATKKEESKLEEAEVSKKVATTLDEADVSKDVEMTLKADGVSKDVEATLEEADVSKDVDTPLEEAAVSKDVEATLEEADGSKEDDVSKDVEKE
jgi:uncharacterized metal-binding protein